MKEWFSKIITFILCSLVLFGTSSAYAAEETFKKFQPKTNISQDKEWSIKFNLSLDKNTVNNNNITVTEENGNVINCYIRLGEDTKTIKVTPKVEGYLPSKNYYLNISNRVKSLGGKNLGQSVKMMFTVTNKYSDSSNYEDVPKITQMKMEKEPICTNEYQTFYLTSNNPKVKYRIYISKYLYGGDKFSAYEEITSGYTYAENGRITTKKYFDAGTKGEKYKVLVYVKRAGVFGSRKDENTDYDNYYIDYFRCIASSNNSGIKNTNYDYTLKDTITKQNSPSVSVTDEGPTSWVGASGNQIKYYLNPSNFLDDSAKYMFLKLNYVDDSITVDDLNNILKGKGILENKGKAFLQGAKENNINPVYLVSHALHETGNGKSKLANGIEVNGAEGKKIAYNMYGIQAFDSNAEKFGSEYAYSQKWFTPEAAIIGGSKWIANRYVNNPSCKRDTLYKMRWNPYTPGSNQYATDIGWAYKQVNNIKALLDKCKKPTLIFEVPIYIK
ncbi:N-acetylglucosaminidase [Clostridium rectalis]|uniref:N-acetylglucosaminidase n=1 Tax=Clostridium rectalis TaxID=2040295 RepID=UPI000F630FDC|nr:N-acetylglucosaminidase [Clostridium rectalis]